MQAAQTIRQALEQVDALRRTSSNQAALAHAIADIKRLQSHRFAATYSDLIKGGPYQAAAQFFLSELYGDKDYSQRDTQFARIAGTIQRTLPDVAVDTAVALAQLHALTEQLDHAMGVAWTNEVPDPELSTAQRYVRAWRVVGRREARSTQLQIVLEIGRDLDKLTRTRGLRLMLKLMRGPAHAAGMAELQQFLEAGFDIFATMGKGGAGSQGFLALVAAREQALLDTLYDADPRDAERLLNPY